MREKLGEKLGAVGVVLWYIISALIYIMPFVMIGKPFWMNLIFIAIDYFFPAASAVFWIWGLICAVRGPQDIYAVIYYVLSAVMFLPFIISVISELFHKN